MGWRRAIIHTDSVMAMQAINQNNTRNHSIRPLLLDCREAMKQLEEVKIVHCYCEGNRLADAVAKHAISMAQTTGEFSLLIAPPVWCKDILDEDMQGY